MEPAQTPSLYFDSSAVGDGSSGCAFTNGSLLSWEQWQETGRITVSGSSVVLADTTVTVTGQTQTVSCVFTAADANRFAAMMTPEAVPIEKANIPSKRMPNVI